MDKQARNASKGSVSIMVKSWSLRTLKPSSWSVSPFATRSAPKMGSAMSLLQDSGCVSSLMKVYRTSDDVSGEPLLKDTPLRKWNV